MKWERSTVLRGIGAAAVALAMGGCQGTDDQGAGDGWGAGDEKIGQAAQALETAARHHRVSGGAHHGLAILLDGSVVGWGDNAYNQVYDKTDTQVLIPKEVQVQGLPLTDMISVAAGGIHSLALKADGTVWAWGYNGVGALGDGTFTPRSNAGSVPGISDVTAVAAGLYHSVALKSDGKVWAWGYNSNGQLGINSITSSAVPLQVKTTSGTNLTDIVAIEAGALHTVALKSNGTVWAWGNNGYGQLGNGSIGGDQLRAKMVIGPSGPLTDVVAIAAGYYHTVALKSDGTVVSWGYGGNGQLGNGALDSTAAPATALNLAGVTAISAGALHTMALTADGTIKAWGMGSYGQLGNGGTASSSTPVDVPSQERFEAIDGGEYFSLATTSTGTIKSWGYNVDGELGINNTTSFPSPQTVTQDCSIIEASAGEKHTVAVDRYGTVWAWGDNAHGQLGTGDTTDSPSATPVIGSDGELFGDVRQVAAGSYHALALKSDGTVWTWGYNASGQLGDGTTSDRPNPVQVQTQAGYLTGVVAIAAGDFHSLALRYDGKVYSWGYNDSGQLCLANGSFADSAYATPVPNFNKVVAIAGGGNHSLAITTSGAAYGCGSEEFGQLCNLVVWDKVSPQKPRSDTFGALGVPNAVGVAAGLSHTLVLRSDGSVYACGDNTTRQLGDGTSNANSSTPVLVINNYAKIVRIAAGGYHSLAMASDGSLLTWGDNSVGQIGNNTVGGTYNTATRIDPQLLSNVTSIAAGLHHSVAVKSSGDTPIWGWGSNQQGQIGDGWTITRPKPTWSSTFLP